MKPSTVYNVVTAFLAVLLVGLFFSVGPEALLREHSSAFLSMVICGATATILREMGR